MLPSRVAETMQSKRLWSNMATAILLLANGVLLGIFESSYVLPAPFLLASYLYFTPSTLKRGRIIGIATLVIVALSMILGLNYLFAGLTGYGAALAQGLVVIGLNVVITIQVVSLFLPARTSSDEGNKT